MNADRCARCGTAHRTWTALARCTWPGADVWGDGPFAVVIACRLNDNRARYGSTYGARVEVVLTEDPDRARTVARWECGGACREWPRGHHVVELVCVPCQRAA